MKKLKLTREQAITIWHMSGYSIDVFLHELEKSGYMEKQETALERAERIFAEWDVTYDIDKSNDLVEKMVIAYREAIKEMQTALDAAYLALNKAGEQ